jgi:hypothetical protein
MIKFEDNTLKKTNEACFEVENLKEEFVQEHQTLEQNRMDYASYIDSTIQNQRYMSSQIRNTDYLIQSKLQLEQRKYETIVNKAKIEVEREERKKTDMERRRKIAEELLEYQYKYQLFRETFKLDDKDKVDIDKFDDTHQFKQFLGNLEIKKTLTQELLENQIRLKELKKKLVILGTEKKVL